MSNFIIRHMQDSDLPNVDNVQRKSFIPELWESVSLFEKMLSHYDQASFVALFNGKIIGYAMAHPAVEGRDDYETANWEITGEEYALYIHDLCVSPEARGQGIAQALFSKIENFAREKKFKKLLGISVQNANNFWKKQGFVMSYPYSYNGEKGEFMVKPL